jgi:hypothetical protein
MLASLHQQLKGWKTVIVNTALGLPAALYGLYLQFGTVDFTPIIPTEYVTWFAVGWSVLGVILRIVTTGPVGSKGDVPATPTTKAGD